MDIDFNKVPFTNLHSLLAWMLNQFLAFNSFSDLTGYGANLLNKENL